MISDHKDYLTVFYDYQTGLDKITSLLKSVYGSMDNIRKREKTGDNITAIDNEKYISTINSCSNAEILNTDELQKTMDEQGIYCIVSSRKMEPSEVRRLYSMINASEIRYCSDKEQSGHENFRVQDSKETLTGFALDFISSVIRFEIEQSAKKLGQTGKPGNRKSGTASGIENK